MKKSTTNKTYLKYTLVRSLPSKDKDKDPRSYFDIVYFPEDTTQDDSVVKILTSLKPGCLPPLSARVNGLGLASNGPIVLRCILRATCTSTALRMPTGIRSKGSPSTIVCSHPLANCVSADRVLRTFTLYPEACTKGRGVYGATCRCRARGGRGCQQGRNSRRELIVSASRTGLRRTDCLFRGCT